MVKGEGQIKTDQNATRQAIVAAERRERESYHGNACPCLPADVLTEARAKGPLAATIPTPTVPVADRVSSVAQKSQGNGHRPRRKEDREVVHFAVIDKDPATHFLIQEALQRLPRRCVLHSYAESEEALREIPGKPCSAALVDPCPPIASGVDYVTRLKALAPELRVIFSLDEFADTFEVCGERKRRFENLG
jgi:hypothetical protein